MHLHIDSPDGILEPCTLRRPMPHAEISSICRGPHNASHGFNAVYESASHILSTHSD